MYYVGPHYSNKNLILLLNLKNTFKYEFPLKNKENMFYEPSDTFKDLIVMCKNWEEVSELGRKRVTVTIFLPILLKMNV